MIDFVILQSESLNPYENLAIEELAFKNTKEQKDCVLLYLWVNEPSVIIGRNQNPSSECRLDYMAENGVHLARRKSGGGAVYQDLGNLNYTFMGNHPYAEKEKWKQIICESINSFSLNCVSSGRNDLIVGESKISGFAYISDDMSFLLHGTMMISVNIRDLSMCLTPEISKLERHGIPSVEHRVGNLSDFNPSVTVEGMKNMIIKTAAGYYGNESIRYVSIKNIFSETMISDIAREFSSADFIFGNNVFGSSSDEL